MACLSKIDRPSMVPEQTNKDEDQVANTTAEIATIEHLKYWTRQDPQAVLDEMNRVRQYYNNTVLLHNKLVDQVQVSAKEVKVLEHELEELGNNHEKQTDDLLQTQSYLDQAQKQIRALKADNAAETTRLQALENNTKTPRLARHDSPTNSNDILGSHGQTNKSSKLPYPPAGKTVDNRSGEASKTVNDQTAPAIDTPDTANSGEGAAAKAGNSNDTDNNIEAATAHNQEVIDCQRQQIRCQQEGPKATTTTSENDGGLTPGIQHQATTDIAPPPFQRLVKPQEPHPYAGGPKGSRRQLQEYLDKINQSKELMPEQLPTKWDFIVWAGTYLEKTAMSDWRRQKEQHNRAWVTYNNYLKVLKQNLSPDEDTDEQNIVTFNAAEPNANDTITSWYK
ncbi:MAG: hypothetical protein FRX48_07017 [Lasallia pustulata]|uniref:Uncharacterized protein n=1 Tax=Lasallia pustulata TaxID=136370 RepID=A0A5M8PJ76_9LECA|nr:MAG: hypothetical protein FRX48_07017 [Lasallia pustulata]